jgi:hypothetical protein
MPARGNVVFLLSSLSFIPTYLFMPENAVLPGSVASSGTQKAIDLAYSFFKVGFIELAQLAAMDRTLLILLIASALLSIMNIKQMSSQCFIATLFSVWLIGAINGTLGVNFRYQLPLLAFACWTIGSNLSQLPNWDGWRRINIVSKKT